MRRHLPFILILASLIICGCIQHEHYGQIKTHDESPQISPSAAKFEFGKRYEAVVVNVIDGDTIDVIVEEYRCRIRLLGIDCPETAPERNKPYEYDGITDLNYLAIWGIRAKEFARDLLLGRKVYLEFDEIAGLKGYYGRYLAYVYLENGTDFNAILIKKGLARVYVEGEFRKEEYYLKLEMQARKNEIGLWSCVIES